MQLRLEPMDEASARAILDWRYEPPYAIYNAVAEEFEEALARMLDPEAQYFAAADEDGDLIAYYCFGHEARVAGGDYGEEALDLGAGLRPDLTGQGFGPELLTKGLELGDYLYKPTAFRATVAAFNVRAQRVCEKVGFFKRKKFVRPSDGLEFVIMIRNTMS